MARFSAHKASYVHRVVENELNSPAEGSDVSPQQKAAARLRMFDQFQRTERNTAIARARTAVQFERFNQPDELRLFPNLRWLPSRSAEPRPTHMQFYNRVWAKDDPFWTTNCPGTEWNCKCDLEQTNDPPTENANIHTPAPPLGLEGNPYHTHQLFTDRVSYIRHNTRLHGAKTAEYQAQSIVRKALKKAAKDSPLKGQTAQCTINGQQVQVNIDAFGLEHCLGDLFGKADYWLKNEILADIVKLLPKASCTGSMRSDNKHNTRRETVRRKTQTDWFYYLDLKLPNGNPIRIHVGHYKDTITEKDKAGKYYLYAITQKL